MKIAICILNWNGKKLLNTFLPSIIKFSKNHSIYLIDNASEDDSVQFVKKQYPLIKIIKNSTNLGFSNGYNVGLKQIKEEIFCLLNSDVQVTKNWIHPIINLFKHNEDIVVIQPKILNYYKTNYFEYAGAAGGKIDFFGYPYCRGRNLRKIEQDKGQYNDIVQIFWASGACFFIRKYTFWQFGGFDEFFFAHMEEIDLCWRINNANKKIYYCGISKVYHIGGQTLKTTSTKKIFLNFRNNLLMIIKNLPKYQWFYILIFRTIFDIIISVIMLFSGKRKHASAIIKAYLSFYKLFSLIYKKRIPGVKKYYQKFSIFLNKCYCIILYNIFF